MPITNSPVTPPPAKKTTTRPKSTVTAEKVDADIRKARHDSIIEFFDMGSAVACALGQFADDATIQIHAPNFAAEGVKLAERYDKIGAALDRFAELAPVAGLAATGVAFLLQLSVNHKMISVERGAAFGAQDPAVLDGEMRLSIQKRMWDAQQEVKRKAQEQAAFQAEMTRMQEEMQAA